MVAWLSRKNISRARSVRYGYVRRWPIASGTCRTRSPVYLLGHHDTDPLAGTGAVLGHDAIRMMTHMESPTRR